MGALNELPPYMRILANGLYNNPRLTGMLADNRIAAMRGLGANQKITRDILREITKNAHVLQIGITYGQEIKQVYEKIKKNGKLDIFDVSEVQVEAAKDRYLGDNICIMNYDASLAWDEKYDVVICYNLLHELPLKTRKKVMDNALAGLTNGGKAIFVDYAEPEWWNPLKWPMFLFNRLYQPFAESLWEKPLETFCGKKDEFRWHHTYYHGKMYQKVVAVRKILSSDDVLKLTKMFNRKA